MLVKVSTTKVLSHIFFSESVIRKCFIEKIPRNILWNSLYTNPDKFIFLTFTTPHPCTQGNCSVTANLPLREVSEFGLFYSVNLRTQSEYQQTGQEKL